VWDIPNVKAAHVEKLGHPCQFPTGLADRMVRALCPKDGVVFDPYSGTASTGVAAVVNGRRFLGAEISEEYGHIAHARLLSAYGGTARLRPTERPIYVAGPKEAVAQRPAHFAEVFQ
jgi:adenine-specific DNA-methyltransferase